MSNKEIENKRREKVEKLGTRGSGYRPCCMYIISSSYGEYKESES